MNPTESGPYQWAFNLFEDAGRCVVENWRLVQAIDRLREGVNDPVVGEVYARLSAILASALEARSGCIDTACGTGGALCLIFRGMVREEEAVEHLTPDEVICLSDATRGVKLAVYPDGAGDIRADWGFSISPQTHHYVEDTNRLIAALDPEQRESVAGGLLTVAEQMFALGTIDLSA
ncbi:hypothetical protein M1555_00170 [Patescibacteria group bacterium]|nr:hypothetical protein [Patescibacteria group bacterium]